MANEPICTGTLKTDDHDRTCVLPAGHVGPVHIDADGVSWGDAEFPWPEAGADAA